MTSDDTAFRTAEAALSEVQVERDVLPDGRYVLYFSWPDRDDRDRDESPGRTDDPEQHV